MKAARPEPRNPRSSRRAAGRGSLDKIDRRGRAAYAISSAASLALLLGGCSDDEGPEIPADAVSEVSDIAGTSVNDPLPLTPADAERLATLANVDPDVLESVASSLGEQDVWQQSMDGVRAIYDDAPEGVESTLVDVACQAIAGTIHTDYQLHYAIFQRVNGFDEQEINGMTETALGLHQVLYDASDSDRAEDRAVAVLTCHTLVGMQD